MTAKSDKLRYMIIKIVPGTHTARPAEGAVYYVELLDAEWTWRNDFDADENCFILAAPARCFGEM